jgi:geranylgeranyl pyrophosphate synthase
VEYSEAAQGANGGAARIRRSSGPRFQITDDLLDVSGDPAHTGKAASDAANNKTTAPAIFGVERSRSWLTKRENRPLCAANIR